MLGDTVRISIFFGITRWPVLHSTMWNYGVPERSNTYTSSYVRNNMHALTSNVSIYSYALNSGAAGSARLVGGRFGFRLTSAFLRDMSCYDCAPGVFLSLFRLLIVALLTRFGDKVFFFQSMWLYRVCFFPFCFFNLAHIIMKKCQEVSFFRFAHEK
jgi:hypothetical protein